jgi:hypothetical protein
VLLRASTQTRNDVNDAYWATYEQRCDLQDTNAPLCDDNGAPIKSRGLPRQRVGNYQQEKETWIVQEFCGMGSLAEACTTRHMFMLDNIVMDWVSNYGCNRGVPHVPGWPAV